MSRVIYSEGDYIILLVYRGYVVYNTAKEFKEGHTHLRSYKSAKNAIYFALNNKIPKNTGLYYLTSLIRISIDLDYIRWLQSLIDVRIQKGSKEQMNKRRK